MRPAGRFVADVLTRAGRGGRRRRQPARARRARPRDDPRARAPSPATSTTTRRSAPCPFGKVLCTSVNDAVLHGLPHDYVLRDGDLLSLDFAASVDGWVADSAVSRRRRHAATRQDLRLIDDHRGSARRRHRRRPARATARRHLGRHRATSPAAPATSVNTEFGGHGVGRTMHGDPHVPNDGRRGRGLALRPGLVIAIEPWFLADHRRDLHRPDGWTLRSADGSRGAHSEHTVAITPTGPVILTARG